MTRMSAQEIESKFECLIELLKNKFSSSKVVFSMTIDRLNDYEFKRKAQTINSKVKDICREHKVQYVFHRDVNKSEDCFREDKIHLSSKGTSILVKNLKDLLRNNHTNQSPRKQSTNFKGKGNDNIEIF